MKDLPVFDETRFKPFNVFFSEKTARLGIVHFFGFRTRKKKQQKL